MSVIEIVIDLWRWFAIAGLSVATLVAIVNVTTPEE